MNYYDFLAQKISIKPRSGFVIDPSEVHPIAKPHQRASIVWGVRGGRRAYFHSFGLGKGIMEQESVRLCLKHSGGQHGIIVSPQDVWPEFMRDAEMLGNRMRCIKRDSEIDEPGLYLTNYEAVREGNVTPARFQAGALDEGAVLRSYGSKTYQEFGPMWEPVPYRFVGTATPDPNRFKELIHYAGWLGIMDTGQALTRFFQRDSKKANNLTLYPHKEAEFWMWVHSWALFLQKPSDLGFSDEGYALPELRVHYHEVRVENQDAGFDRDGQGRLFRNASLGLPEAAREKRDSLPQRIEKMVEILKAEPERNAILWHDLEAEREAISKAVPGVAEIYGNLDTDTRVQRLVDFSNGKLQYLGTKPELSGAGCNFQRHCSMEVFVGIGHKFHDFIQALHRIYRFLQTEVCDVHIIYSEAEREILADLRAKWSRHNQQVERMSQLIRENGLADVNMAEVLKRTIGVSRIESSGDNYVVANNDCVIETQSMESNSVDLIVTSIPFGNHYEYAPSYNDFGNTENNDHFWKQMDYLTPELMRVLKPGRIACIHVKNRIEFGSVTGLGFPREDYFLEEASFHYRRHGLPKLGIVTVVTDVVRENNQTYRLGYTEMLKDSTKMGVGCSEYILILRKPQTNRQKGYADERVTKSDEEYSLARWQVDAHALWRSNGNRLLTAEELMSYGPDKLAKLFTQFSLQNVYDYESHVKIGEELEGRHALPSTFMSLAPGSHHPLVWHDVNRMRTLNGEQARKGLEYHVCPLQFDIIDRCINRFSKRGDLVYDPFGGLLSTVVRALKLGRRGRAAELNAGYFFDGLKYCESVERELSMPSMFDAEAA